MKEKSPPKDQLLILRPTANSGWIVEVETAKYQMPLRFAYSTTNDMLEALTDGLSGEAMTAPERIWPVGGYAQFIAGRKSLHEFAGGIAPGSVHYVNPLDLNSPTDAARSAEEIADAFGRDMFRRCGKNWPTMIALASGAAMRAERDATGEVK